MPKQDESHRVYKALLYLYPKAHREEYGGQMVQTLDDLLSDRQGAYEKIGIWLRIGRELPLNVIEEHINNLEGVTMDKILKGSGKWLAIGGGVVVVAAIGLGFALNRNHGFSPTTLAQVQRTSDRPACLQTDDDPNLRIDSQEREAIENTVVGSIIDVPAGTNVGVYLKTYKGSDVTGSAIYAGVYGSYNFTAKKTPNSTDPFLGGWKVTRFDACEPSSDLTSHFSFAGAADWKQGPSNRTSIALFYTPSDCFTSVEYKTGTVDAAAELKKRQDDMASSGFTSTPGAVVQATMQTNTGQQQYELHQYTVAGGGGGDRPYTAQEFGYLQLKDGYIKVEGYCDAAEHLPATIPALQAIKFDQAN